MLEVIGSDGDVWYRVDAPILGTIRECQSVDYGWRGTLPNGRTLEVRSAHPDVHADMPADGWLKVRFPENRLYPFMWDVFEGRLLGVYLIEHRGSPVPKRRPSRSAKRAARDRGCVVVSSC